VAKSEQVAAFVDYYSADPAEAIKTLSRASEIYRRRGDQFLLADSLVSTTLPYANLAQWDVVGQLMNEGLDIFVGNSNESGIAMVYEILGAANAVVGQSHDAGRLFGASDNLRARIGGGAPTQLVNTDAYRNMVEQELGQERFAELRAEGAQMSDADALSLARGFKAAPGSPALPTPEPWGKEAEKRARAAEANK
jgi:hypothetical protein